MCGEAAGGIDAMIPLLLSFGLDEFSVSPSNVLETRKNIASWSIREADEVTTSVMAMCTEKEVANYLLVTILQQKNNAVDVLCKQGGQILSSPEGLGFCSAKQGGQILLLLQGQSHLLRKQGGYDGSDL